MASFQSWSTTSIASAIVIICLVYLAIIAIHRLYFSRYAKFPGPKLAGLTYGYMFYYDVIVGDGQYYKKIEKLHKEYREF